MRYTQPQSGPVQIDWSNPITQGMIAACLPHLRVEAVNNRAPVQVGAFAASVSKLGIGLLTNGSNNNLYFPIPLITLTQWTIFGVFKSNAAGADSRSMNLGRSTDSTPYIPLGTGNLDARTVRVLAQSNTGTLPANQQSVGFCYDGTVHSIALTYDGSNVRCYIDGVLDTTASTSTGAAWTVDQINFGCLQRPTGVSFWPGSSFVGAAHKRALSGSEIQQLHANHWQLFRSPQRVYATTAGGTDTPVNPGVGALALTGYSPAVTQSANLSLTPSTGSIGITGYAPSISQPQAITAGAGALTLTGYAPTVTQGITTSIVPGAGTLALSGYAPSIAQSANQSVMPDAGSLSISGYVPAIAQTANQSVAPAPGSLTLTGFAPTVAQALASPNLVPEVGALSITGYAPIVEQSAPITKIGGDDAPRHDEEDERVEVWEKRAPTPRRDDSLDKVVREAYAKATGKPIAEAVAKPGPSVRAPAPDPFDFEEDDFEVLLLSY